VLIALLVSLASKEQVRLSLVRLRSSVNLVTTAYLALFTPASSPALVELSMQAKMLPLIPIALDARPETIACQAPTESTFAQVATTVRLVRTTSKTPRALPEPSPSSKD